MLGVGEDKIVQVTFDPAFQKDEHSRIVKECITLSYKQHPHTVLTTVPFNMHIMSQVGSCYCDVTCVCVFQDQVRVRGEVFYPNLTFEKKVVDFGCILNDTEVTRYINVTNTSPLEVRYRWSFIVDDEPVAVFLPRPKVAPFDAPSEQTVTKTTYLHCLFRNPKPKPFTPELLQSSYTYTVHTSFTVIVMLKQFPRIL